MIDLKNIGAVYLTGIGGIGMSALAKYFLEQGQTVAGYDRTETDLTVSLASMGCAITYSDDPATIPDIFRDISCRSRVLAIYTPAIPGNSNILAFFRDNGHKLYKRSEILGEISSHTDTLAVAGTHGKTTVSTMIAHILTQSHIGCSAFLGGISKNYGSNYLSGRSRYTVMEADEFDRSFHRLSPLMAVVTSVDADHLDIYGSHEEMIVAYQEFCRKIRPGGRLLIHNDIRNKINVPDSVAGAFYGPGAGSDYRAAEIRYFGDYYVFNLETPEGRLDDIHFSFPGRINIENITAASAIALMCGVTGDELRTAISVFKGVRRRFDIRVNKPGITYIDDYAHHPEEIKACIKSVREYFGGRKITGIFQPHLYSRTRDHAEGFASILDLLDEIILLPIYPTREEPIPGVSSEMIFSRMKSENKTMLKLEDLPDALDVEKLDVLVTIGAGSIDKLVIPIENKLKNLSGA